MNYCPTCATELAETLIDGEIRRACAAEQCEYVHWNNPTPVLAGLVELDGKMVMAHNVAWPKEFYSVITGFLEKGETPEDGIIRETKEELNLHALDVSLVGVYAFEQMNQVIIAYHVRAAGEIKLNHELDDYRLVPMDELQPWKFGTGLAIKDFLQQRQSQS